MAKQFNKIEIFHLKLAMEHYLKAEIAEARQRIKDDEWNTEEGVAVSAALDDLRLLYEKVRREFKSPYPSQKEKVYSGERLGPREKLPEVEVMVNGKPLKHRVRHSPTGFEWGYGGSGPADLALSILWDFLGREPKPIEYMRFKEQFVAGWSDRWSITGKEIENWLDFEFARTREGAGA